MIVTVHGQDYEFSPHALDEMDDDDISINEVVETLKFPNKIVWKEVHQTYEYRKDFGIGKDRDTVVVAVDRTRETHRIATVFLAG